MTLTELVSREAETARTARAIYAAHKLLPGGDAYAEAENALQEAFSTASEAHWRALRELAEATTTAIRADADYLGDAIMDVDSNATIGEALRKIAKLIRTRAPAPARTPAPAPITGGDGDRR